MEFEFFGCIWVRDRRAQSTFFNIAIYVIKIYAHVYGMILMIFDDIGNIALYMCIRYCNR